MSRRERACVHGFEANSNCFTPCDVISTRHDRCSAATVQYSCWRLSAVSLVCWSKLMKIITPVCVCVWVLLMGKRGPFSYTSPGRSINGPTEHVAKPSSRSTFWLNLILIEQTQSSPRLNATSPVLSFVLSNSFQSSLFNHFMLPPCLMHPDWTLMDSTYLALPSRDTSMTN